MYPYTYAILVILSLLLTWIVYRASWMVSEQCLLNSTLPISSFNEEHSYLKEEINSTPVYSGIALMINSKGNIHASVHSALIQLSADWHVVVLHGNATSGTLGADQRIREAQQQQKITLLYQDYLNDTFTLADYNHLLSEHWLWQRICQWTDRVLLLETDSILCANPTYNISDFLVYDYVGAPWPGGPCGYSNFGEAVSVGNSGLSLWRVSTMLQVTANAQKPASLPIDVWTCQQLVLAGARMPTAHVAEYFSVEMTAYRGGYTPVGVHKPWMHQSQDSLALLRDRCPQLALIQP